MNPERWRQISQLYYAVLAQDSTGRATFLADACGADAELRETLESLLAQPDSAEHFLRVPDLEFAAPARSEAQAASMPMEGRRVGAWWFTPCRGSPATKVEAPRSTARR